MPLIGYVELSIDREDEIFVLAVHTNGDTFQMNVLALDGNNRLPLEQRRNVV